MKDQPHSHRLRNGPLLALGSAFLFGASTPIAKLLLGVTDPLLLAGLLYLGSGIGLALATAAGRSFGVVRPEAPLRARDLPWLGAIVLFGGILGPVRSILRWHSLAALHCQMSPRLPRGPQLVSSPTA
jgi:drug/metabolite transporter (DMT)-like permease